MSDASFVARHVSKSYNIIIGRPILENSEQKNTGLAQSEPQ